MSASGAEDLGSKQLDAMHQVMKIRVGLFLYFSLFGDVDENAGGSHDQNEGGTAVGDEGKGNAGEGNEGDDGGKIDQSLEANPGDDARGQELTKFVGSLLGNFKTSPDKEEEKKDKNGGADEADFPFAH